MIKKFYSKTLLAYVLAFLVFVSFAGITHALENTDPKSATIQVSESGLGFKIPNFSDILTFAIRAFFVIAGLSALFFLLLGAFGWVTSGGDKDAITASRDKIQAAVVGLILIVAVLAIIVTLEKVVFASKICLGLSCPASIPTLLEPR